MAFDRNATCGSRRHGNRSGADARQANDEIVEVLRKSNLLLGASAAEVTALASSSQRAKYVRGHVLTRSAAGRTLLVERGGLRLTCTSPAGRCATLFQLSPGEWYGLAQVCGDLERIGDVIAGEQDTSVICIPVERMRELAKRNVELLLALNAEMARRLVKATRHAERVALYSLKARLAEHLGLSAEMSGGTVSRTNRELAQSLGIDEGDLSKLLKQLSAEGLIQKAPYRSVIVVPDVDRLLALMS
jgi:CRP-like cAMP-binding protein